VTSEFFRARDALGRPVFYIAIVPEDCEIPDDAARKAMTRGRDEVLPHCDSMSIVMEGSGFRNAILRNALAAMQLFGRKRDRVQVYRTVEELLPKLVRTVPDDLKFDVKVMLSQARATGVLTVAKGPM